MKGKDDPVTIVDREVEDFPDRRADQARPRRCRGGRGSGRTPIRACSSTLSERSAGSSTRSTAPPISPRAKGSFGIMVALADAGEAVAGWIYDPQRDRLVPCAARRRGLHRRDTRARAAFGRDPCRPCGDAALFMEPEQREMFESEIAPHYDARRHPALRREQYPLTCARRDTTSPSTSARCAWDHAAGVAVPQRGGRQCRAPMAAPYRVDDGAQAGMIGAAEPRIVATTLPKRLDGGGLCYTRRAERRP